MKTTKTNIKKTTKTPKLVKPSPATNGSKPKGSASGSSKAKGKTTAKPKPKASPKVTTRFELLAPEAGMVFLAGTFNDWDPSKNPLTKGKKGLWKSELNLSPGEYEYLFVVDGVWTFDPAAAQHAPNPFGSSNCLRLVA